jgi:hypothetical protein
MDKLIIYNFAGFCLIIIGIIISLTHPHDINYRITGACISFLGIFMIVSFILYAGYVVLLKNRNENIRRDVNELVSRYTEEQIPELVYSDTNINQDAIEICSLDDSYLDVGEYEEAVFSDN